jgi:hypothetical protein
LWQVLNYADKDKMKTIRENQEEVHLQGPEGPEDIRIIQSYPSKVS